MPHPRKRFAQYWLQSDQVLHQIAQSAQLKADDCLLEIGPGTGNLTRVLLPLVKALVAVEVDWDLCRTLGKTFQDHKNFLLLQGDILSLDLAGNLANFPQFQKLQKVVANIPYNITGPILELLLGTIAQPNPQPFELIVLLIQQEVAERLCAQPGTKAFGALTVRVQYLADCELVHRVPAKAFHPKPKVDSAIVRIVPRPFPKIAHSPKRLAQLVKLGFATKRKMLRNNLQGIVDRDRLGQLLESLNLNPQVRAEDLSVGQWVELSNLLESN